VSLKRHFFGRGEVDRLGRGEVDPLGLDEVDPLDCGLGEVEGRGLGEVEGCGLGGRSDEHRRGGLADKLGPVVQHPHGHRDVVDPPTVRRAAAAPLRVGAECAWRWRWIEELALRCHRGCCIQGCGGGKGDRGSEKGQRLREKGRGRAASDSKAPEALCCICWRCVQCGVARCAQCATRAAAVCASVCVRRRTVLCAAKSGASLEVRIGCKFGVHIWVGWHSL
jgi:hypothetical protein